MARMTDFPNGLQTNKLVADLLTAEPSGKIFNDGVDYSDRVKAGGTYGCLWLENDGIHYNVAGVERVVPLTSTSGSNSLDVAYDVGRTISVDQGPVILNDATTSTADTLQINKTGAGSGDMIQLDLDAGVGARALYIDAGAGARTSELIEINLDGTFGSAAGGTVLDLNISQTGAAASSAFDIDVSSIYTGSIFDVAIGAAATTGYVLNIDLNAGVAYGAINLDAGAAARTVDLIDVTFDGTGNVSVLDINATNTGSGNIIDIDIDAVHTGHAVGITYATAAATGDALNIAMGTNVAGGALVISSAGARTDSLIDIADASTGNAGLFKIATTGVYTGNIIELSCNTAAATGNVINIDMDTNLAGNAIYVDAGAGNRTADLIKAKFDGVGNVSLFEADITNTGSGDLIDLNIDSVHTGSAIGITYGTAAATGDALDLAMGTNVAGRAIAITSAATGADGEGACIDIAHTGNLIANADVVRISSTGSPNAASHLLAIEQSTGAGSAGATGLYINCTGTNVEAIKVDAGGVVLDETLAVAGATTMTGTLTTGVNDTGVDVKFFGATSGTYCLWDESADSLILAGAGKLSVAGLTTLTAGIDGKVIFASTETIAAGNPGALDLTKCVHDVDADAGGDTFTLANGVVGQITTVVLKTATGVATITPATFLGGTSVTLNAAGDSVMFQYGANGWFIIGGNSYAVV